MDNQHRMISGYRELSQGEIGLMNEIKAQGEQLGALVARLRTYAEPLKGDIAVAPLDVRWINIGATHLQEGLMALTRAVAQPTTF